MKTSKAAPDPSAWYATLAAIACLATLQALVLPRWPRATSLPQAALEHAMRKAGLDAEPLQAGPPQRSFDLASSRLLAYKLEDGEELQLVDVTVRERLKFDMNTINGKLPSLRLEDSRISPDPPFYAIGQINGHPARQTCLVPGLGRDSGFAVSQDQLWIPVDALAREDSREILRRVIGLGSKRSYRCILITVRAAPGRPLNDARWQSLLSTLRPVLEQGVEATAADSGKPSSTSESPPHG